MFWLADNQSLFINLLNICKGITEYRNYKYQQGIFHNLATKSFSFAYN